MAIANLIRAFALIRPEASVSPDVPRASLGELGTAAQSQLAASAVAYAALLQFGASAPPPVRAATFPDYYGYGGAYQAPEPRRQAAPRSLATGSSSQEDLKLFQALLAMDEADPGALKAAVGTNDAPPAYYGYGGAYQGPEPQRQAALRGLATGSSSPAFYGYGGAYDGPETERRVGEADAQLLMALLDVTNERKDPPSDDERPWSEASPSWAPHLPDLASRASHETAYGAAGAAYGMLQYNAGILGPFFKKGAPNQTALRLTGEPGFPLKVTGKVLNTRGEKVPGARIDIWHADHKGLYDLEGFRYRSKLLIESADAYSVDTIMPGHYDDRPAQHIHYMITAPGHRTLVTQAYFATDPFFEGDPDKNFKKRGIASSRELIRPVTLFEQPNAPHAAITFDIILEKA